MNDAAKTGAARPAISAGEMERRREALRAADAGNRLDGLFRDPATDEIFEALIRGEIDVPEVIKRFWALSALR